MEASDWRQVDRGRKDRGGAASRGQAGSPEEPAKRSWGKRLGKSENRAGMRQEFFTRKLGLDSVDIGAKRHSQAKQRGDRSIYYLQQGETLGNLS